MRRIAFLALLLAVGCQDPVHDDKVSALGPEPGPYERGPLHRPGQPCTVCHGGKGPSHNAFDLAGTTFYSKNSLDPLAFATVVLYDADGNTEAYGTNDVGNFFIKEGELTLQYPLWVAIESSGVRVRMETPIFRARSCAQCHFDPVGTDSVGHVFLVDTP